MSMIDRTDFLIQVSQLTIPTVTTNKRLKIYNIPASFDIEVSSFYQDGIVIPENKRAIMYIWMFGIGDLVTYGRTWEEFMQLIDGLKIVLDLNENRRLYVYVHNLPYEWQFIRKRIQWDQVFFLEDRKPVKARVGGLEFRCSLKLSGGKSLANVGKDLQNHKLEKKVGDLDYNLIRTPLTHLTEKELGYCEYDIRVLNAYIAEKIEQDGGIDRIPLTNTGYVREYCRRACFRAVEEVSRDNGGFDYEF